MRRRLRACLIRIATAGLVFLHAALLWQRVADLSIRDPFVMGRWLAAAAAGIAAVAMLRRRAGWRWWVVFWLVIVLLHAIAPVHVRVIAQSVFVLALSLFVVGLTAANLSRSFFFSVGSAAFPNTPLTNSLASRAPPPSFVLAD